MQHEFIVVYGQTTASAFLKVVYMVPTVRESQGILRSQGKSGKIQTVRGSQGIQKYHGAKVNKDAEKNRTVARTLHTAVQNFFCLLRSQIIYTFTFSFVLPPLFLVLLQVIESQHWYFA